MQPSFLLTPFLPAPQRTAEKKMVQPLPWLLFIPSLMKETFVCLRGHVTGMTHCDTVTVMQSGS